MARHEGPTTVVTAKPAQVLVGRRSCVADEQSVSVKKLMCRPEGPNMARGKVITRPTVFHRAPASSYSEFILLVEEIRFEL
jgi:hypothetical protein